MKYLSKHVNFIFTNFRTLHFTSSDSMYSRREYLYLGPAEPLLRGHETWVSLKSMQLIINNKFNFIHGCFVFRQNCMVVKSDVRYIHDFTEITKTDTKYCGGDAYYYWVFDCGWIRTGSSGWENRAWTSSNFRRFHMPCKTAQRLWHGVEFCV